jgi:hypothetical protein
MVKPGKQCRRRKDFDPGSGQFNAEREAIQATADSGDGRGVALGQREIWDHRLGPRDE